MELSKLSDMHLKKIKNKIYNKNLRNLLQISSGVYFRRISFDTYLAYLEILSFKTTLTYILTKTRQIIIVNV